MNETSGHGGASRSLDPQSSTGESNGYAVRRARSLNVYLLAHGPATRRGRLGAYLWDIRATWTERLLPRPVLVRVVLRDALRGHR